MQISGWDIAAVFAKAVTYAATLGAAGAVFFAAYCEALLRDAQRRLILRLIVMLVGAAVAGGVLRILLLAGSMSGDLSGMFDPAFAGMILGAGEGRASAVRLAGFALMLLVLSKTPVFRAAAVAGAIAASTSFAWLGHIHALLPSTAPSLFLCLHLVCAAFWLGALPPLLIIAAAADGSQLAAAAARFAHLALGVVAFLLAAGVSMLVLLIANAAQFWASDYGRMMLIKLLAVAVLLGVVGRNKLVLTPRLLQGEALAALQFRRAVRAEMGIGALILLTTAAFTTLAGPP